MHRTSILIASSWGLLSRPTAGSAVRSQSCSLCRKFTSKNSKSSPVGAMDPTPRSLELLRQTLREKRMKLQEISERQAASGFELDFSLSQNEGAHSSSTPTPTPDRRQQSRQNMPDRSMPIFASPADMNIRLPKVIRDFKQPEGAEIAKIVLIGSPNVGKSTIVNDLVKSNVSIVSLRPHTTRERIKAVLTQDNKQVLFYDTPGVVPEKNVSRLNRELVTASWKALEDSDHLLVVMDCHKLLEHGKVTESYIFERLGKMEPKIPATLVFNKIDLVKGKDEKLQEIAQKYQQLYPNFVKTIYTSANTPMVGIQELRTHLLSLTKAGPWLYPAEQKSDQSHLKRVEDIIRSELYGAIKVPYSIKQVNTGWTELEDGVLRIDQNLVVDRPGLKKIVVGSDGAVIRDITLNSRQLIGKALGRRIMLSLQIIEPLQEFFNPSYITMVYAEVPDDPTAYKRQEYWQVNGNKTEDGIVRLDTPVALSETNYQNPPHMGTNREERYSKEESFDWFKTYEDLKPLLSQHINSKDARILMLGCGNSTLSEDMYDDGYHNIVNIDFSKTVIENMTEKCKDRVGMEWIEMDIRDLKFEDQSFDIVIDKGTMDALMCDRGDVWNPDEELVKTVAEEVDEVVRVLKVGGKFLYITFGQPHFRKRHLERPCWTVNTSTLGVAFHYFFYHMIKEDTATTSSL